MYVFENYVVYFTTASNVAHNNIIYTYIFTLITHRIIFKEKINMVKAVGAFFSISGIGIIIFSKGKEVKFVSQRNYW